MQFFFPQGRRIFNSMPESVKKQSLKKRNTGDLLTQGTRLGTLRVYPVLAATHWRYSEMSKNEHKPRVELEKRLDPVGHNFFIIFVQSYNSSLYISECLDSLLDQTFEDYAILIFDDGSEDSTREILLDYAKKNPEKIFLRFAKANSFDTPSARFVDLRDLDFSFLLICDADDYFPSREKLVRYHNAIESNSGAGVLSSNTILFGDGSKLRHLRKGYRRVEKRINAKTPFGVIYKWLYLGLPTPSLCVRKDLLPIEELSKNPRLYPTDLIIKARAKRDGHHIHLNERLSAYRVRDDNSSYGKSPSDQLRETRTIAFYLAKDLNLSTLARVAFLLIQSYTVSLLVSLGKLTSNRNLG